MNLSELQEKLFAGSGASVDTRTLQPGEVFFALPGTRQHGGDFALTAWEKGASAVVLPDDYPTPAGLPPEVTLHHPDPLALLGEMARLYRRQFPLPVIAIGGSNGKTTTKALLGHLLAHYAPTLLSPQSWNNAIGLPLTLLRLSPHHRFAVVEIGDNHPGEVYALCQIAHPTHGLLTNIGEDHLEGYGSIEANLATKWELVEYLEKHEGQALYLNGEDSHLTQQTPPPSLSVRYFGTHPQSCATGTWIPQNWDHSTLRGCLYGTSFSVELPLWGSFNRLNVLAALLVAYDLGVPLSSLLHALKSFQPEKYRSQVYRYGNRTFLVDAYNANPSSLRASLMAVWETLPADQRVVLVLGQMEELGSFTPSAHAQVLRELLPHADKIGGLVLVGEAWEVPELPFPVLHIGKVEELTTQPPSWFQAAPLLYLKGSRRQSLEKLLPT